MLPQKHTVNQAQVSETAPAGTGFGFTPTRADRDARLDRVAVIGGWIGSGVAKLIASIGAAHRRRVATAELNALDSRMLADIGITRSDIGAAVAGASGFQPRVLGMSAAAPSLNDDSIHRVA